MLLRIILCAVLLTGPAMAADVSTDDSFDQSAWTQLTNAELSEIRGTGLPLVGLDQEQSAAAASTIVIGTLGPRPGDTIQELTDNWNLAVATPLIAAAASAGR